MFKRNVLNNKNLILLLFFLIIIIFSIINKNYLISILYILTILISLYLMKNKNIYNFVYAILLVSLFFDYSLYLPHIEKIYIFHIVLFIFTLLSLYRLFKHPDIFLKLDKKILVFYLIAFIYMCISITWALNKALSLKYLAIYIMMFAFIIDMMVYNINNDNLKHTITLLILLFSLVAIIGLCEVLLGKQLPIKHYYDSFNLSKFDYHLVRARGLAFSFNTNNLAITLAIFSPLFFYCIYKFNNIPLKIYFYIISCMMFSLIVITTSRTGVESIKISFALFFVYCILNLKNIKLKGLVFPLLILISFVFLRYNSLNLVHIQNIDDSSKSKINSLLTDKMDALTSANLEVGGDGSINVRYTIANDVINGVLIKEKNLLGYGVGNVEQYLKNQNNTNNVFSPHGLVIELLGDFGVPGIILYGIYYLYLLISNIIIGLKQKSIPCIACATSLLAFPIASFGPSSITYVFSYWLLIAISISCIQVYKRDTLQEIQT